MLRRTSDGALSATVTLASIEINGTPPGGLALRVSCPTAFTGTSPSLAMTVYASSSSTATSDGQQVGYRILTAYGDYIMPFVTSKRSVIVELTVAGTSPSLGAVEIGIVKNVGFDWNRNIEFH